MPNERQQQVVSALEAFLSTPLDAVLQHSAEADAGAAALDLFRRVAARVPAYRVLLRDHGIDPATIQTPADFRTLPLLTKKNYVQHFPLAELCWDGLLENCDMVAVSSGSTGQPTFWPRSISDEYVVARRFEQTFRDSFNADTRRTLAVVCFALGTWVGGMYTASCCRHLAAKGYPITVVTPGNNHEEIFRVVRELGPAFEQVVLLGYPPFLKDVIDRGLARGMDWAQYQIKLVTAGEVFSEEWRALVGERAGIADPCYGSTSLYGTADAGVLGVETPLSIAIRRFLAATPDAARALFGEARLPTLVQYDPLSRFFEVKDGTLLFSGDNGAPLIRYHIADSGGLVAYDEMLTFLAQHGFDPLAELQRHSGRGAHRLPFVYIFGRADFTVSFFGANVYPENVTVGLEQPEISGWVTGKFVLEALEDADANRVLSVVVELAPDVESSAARQHAVAEAIQAQLLRLNSEFAHYVPREQQLPRVTLLPASDPTYFPAGVKHRYTRRTA